MQYSRGRSRVLTFPSARVPLVVSFLMRPFAYAVLALILAQPAAQAAEDPLKNAPPTYRDAMIAAMRAFTNRDFAMARELVQKADSTYQRTPVSLNVLGAILIEEKKFDEGRENCLQALRMDPKYFPARFNLAEIPFVQGKYGEARALFERLQKDEPDDDLLRFRIFLTLLLEKNDSEARLILDEIPLINNSPISFYANAAWDFAHGKEDSARNWIASGLRTFPPIKHVNFIEVFYDLGWLKRETVEVTAKPPEKQPEEPAEPTAKP
jgi:tetratricopeptide (TPR) repeat protein